MRKVRITILLSVMILSFWAAMAMAAYPEKAINGYISWGAGGGTDTVVRAVAPLAEKELGQTIILQNKPGGGGVIGHMYAYNQPADGYNLLFQAENPGIFQVMNLSQITYDQFDPIMIFLQAINILVVAPDSPYKTIEEFMTAAKEKKLTIGACGIGSQAHIIATMLKSVSGIEFNFVNFDGDGAAVTALMGGHVDFVPSPSPTCLPFIKSGKLRSLATMTLERYSETPDTPAIMEFDKGYSRFLPWGAFYGAFLKKGAPKEAYEKLVDAFDKSVNSDYFDDFASHFGGIKLGYTGKEAEEYLTKQKSISSWLMFYAGEAKVSPKELNIPEPK